MQGRTAESLPALHVPGECFLRLSVSPGLDPAGLVESPCDRSDPGGARTDQSDPVAIANGAPHQGGNAAHLEECDEPEGRLGRQRAQSAALPESKAAAYQACVHDERAAYDELRKKWPRYSAKSRVTCAEPGGGAAISYVELQTCLDMQPGGSLTVPGPAPGGAPAVDTMAYPSPVAPTPGQKE